MVNIVFKTKKEAAKPKDNAPVKSSAVNLSIFANFFNWFVVLICVIVLASGYWWLIKPKYDVVINDEAFKQQEKVYQDKIAYLKKLNEVKNIYNNISDEEKQKIDTIISANEDIETFKINLLKEITYLGKLNNVAIESFEITPLDNSQDKFVDIVNNKTTSVPGDNLQIVTVSFIVKNVEYDQLKRMLTRFEKSLRFIDITKLSYSPDVKQASIELFAYHLNPEEVIK
jgi:hypothetical protein